MSETPLSETPLARAVRGNEWDRRFRAVRAASELLDEAGYPDDAQAVLALVPPSEPEWMTRSKHNNEIVKKATGVDGHAIRCGFAVLEHVGANGIWTEADCGEIIGRPFIWLKWSNTGAIVDAEPWGEAVRVEVWAVP